MGTKKDPMENILRDFKSFTSRKLKEAIQNNPQESRREWIVWMMKRAGTKNRNNNDWSRGFGSSNTTSLLSYLQMRCWISG
jgi:hypothetical protein